MQFRYFYFGTRYHPERYPEDWERIQEDASLMEKLHMNTALIAAEALSRAAKTEGGCEWLAGIVGTLNGAGILVSFEVPEDSSADALLLKMDPDDRVLFYKISSRKADRQIETIRRLKTERIRKAIAVEICDRELFREYTEENEPDIVCFSHHADWMGGDLISAGRQAAFLEDRARSVKREHFFLTDVDPMFTVSERGTKLRKPGILSLEIFQAAIHGSRGFFFRDLRQALSGPDRYAGAVIGHSGKTDTNRCEEIEQIGRLLLELTDLAPTRTDARIAVLCGEDVNFGRAYRVWGALRSLGVSVDVIDPGEDFSRYAFIAACGVRRVSDEMALEVRRYVENGGVFFAEWGFASEDGDGNCRTGDTPHDLTDVFGISVIEADCLYADEEMPLEVPGDFKGKHSSRTICEIARKLDADVMVRYGGGFYKGRPALSRKQYGEGFAYYMATDCGDTLLKLLFDKILRNRRGIARVKMTDGITVQRLFDENAEYLAFQNFTEKEKRLPLIYNKMDILFGYDPVPVCGMMILRVLKKK